MTTVQLIYAAIATIEPDFHACRRQKCVRSAAISVDMTMKGGKDGNVGGFGGQNAGSLFSGVVNRDIMPLKLGGWAVHCGLYMDETLIARLPGLAPGDPPLTPSDESLSYCPQ